MNLEDYTYKPAVVSSLVSLDMALGDSAAAAKVFEDTVAWYRKQKVYAGINDLICLKCLFRKFILTFKHLLECKIFRALHFCYRK